MDNTTRVFAVDDYSALESISPSLTKKVCRDIETRWKIKFGRSGFIWTSAIIACIVIASIIAVAALWRLSILARRKFFLNQLDDARKKLNTSRSEINQLYSEPKITVVNPKYINE